MTTLLDVPEVLGGTVTPDPAAATPRCRCGIRVVTPDAPTSAVHYDPARDLHLPPDCADAARVLAARDLLAQAAADKARAAAVEAELAPFAASATPPPLPVVLRAYATYAARLAVLPGGIR